MKAILTTDPSVITKKPGKHFSFYSCDEVCPFMKLFERIAFTARNKLIRLCLHAISQEGRGVAFIVGIPGDIPSFYSQTEPRYSAAKNIFPNNSVKNYSRWK